MARSFINNNLHQANINLLADSVIEIVNHAQERQITVDEACALMTDCETDSLLTTAGKIRDARKPGSTITYSRKVFMNLINLCRDSCTYCTYKKEPAEALASMMVPSEVIGLAELGKKMRCTEALFVTGERPEQKYQEARTWLRSLGHSSTVEYIAQMCELVLEKTGLLPHTNAGSLTKKEMALLKDTNVSLGVMLESSSERLMEENMPHEYAPSKNPKVRIRTLEAAGELRIPMTTGILVGIGESAEELVESLFVIKKIHEKYGHIQEVIMQNFAPKPGTRMESFPAASFDYFLRAVALARIVMPDMNIQVPPNLSPRIFRRYIDAGINDWGGISPVTIDHVNPEFPWPSIESVKAASEEKGKHLRARLPVYPEFLKGGFITAERLQNCVKAITDDSGLVSEEYVND